MYLLKQIKRRFFPTIVEQLGYSDKDIIVIANIDDVGLHKDETEASFKAFKSGMVKSGSLMTPCPNFDRAIELWKDNPEVDLGVHLTLTCEWGVKYPWAPILPKNDIPSLYNSQGIMWQNVKELLLHAKREDIERELEAQIKKVLNKGLKPSHLDYHMNFAFQANLFPIVLKLSCKYKIPMRVPKNKKFKFPFIRNNFWSLRRKGYVFADTRKGLYMMSGEDQTLEYRKTKYHEQLRSLKPGINNINLHIAFHTKELENIMGFHDVSIRNIDYDVWTSDDTKLLAKELGIIFTDFRRFQKLQERLMKHI